MTADSVDKQRVRSPITGHPVPPPLTSERAKEIRQIPRVEKKHFESRQVSAQLTWMRQRLQQGMDANEVDTQLILDMMDGGDKARFHVLRFLIEIKNNAETVPQQVMWADKMLQWVKLQYGEKHLNLNIETRTSVDDMLRLLEDYNDESTSGTTTTDTNTSGGVSEADTADKPASEANRSAT